MCTKGLHGRVGAAAAGSASIDTAVSLPVADIIQVERLKDSLDGNPHIPLEDKGEESLEGHEEDFAQLEILGIGELAFFSVDCVLDAKTLGKEHNDADNPEDLKKVEHAREALFDSVLLDLFLFLDIFVGLHAASGQLWFVVAGFSGRLVDAEVDAAATNIVLEENSGGLVHAPARNGIGDDDEYFDENEPKNEESIAHKVVVPVPFKGHRENGDECGKGSKRIRDALGPGRSTDKKNLVHGSIHNKQKENDEVDEQGSRQCRQHVDNLWAVNVVHGNGVYKPDGLDDEQEQQHTVAPVFHGAKTFLL